MYGFEAPCGEPFFGCPGIAVSNTPPSRGIPYFAGGHTCYCLEIEVRGAAGHRQVHWRHWFRAWTENNKDTDIPAFTNGAGNYSTYTAAASTRFLTSNSFLSLNNVQVGYNFPKKWIEKIKLNKLNLYVAANNLAIATARRGYNPMTSFTGSSDTHAYSPLSTIVGGVKFTF